MPYHNIDNNLKDVLISIGYSYGAQMSSFIFYLDKLFLTMVEQCETGAKYVNRDSYIFLADEIFRIFTY